MADQTFIYDFELGLTHGAPLVVSAAEGSWRMGTSDRGLTLQVEVGGVMEELTVNPSHLMYIRTIKREVEPPADQVSADGSIKVSA